MSNIEEPAPCADGTNSIFIKIKFHEYDKEFYTFIGTKINGLWYISSDSSVPPLARTWDGLIAWITKPNNFYNWPAFEIWHVSEYELIASK